MTPTKEHFYVQLLPTRDSFPGDMTEHEDKIMTDHFQYLKDLVKQRKILLAGPVLEPVFGLVIVEAASKAEARKLIENDPSVKEGLLTFQISPMRVALMAENTPESD